MRPPLTRKQNGMGQTREEARLLRRQFLTSAAGGIGLTALLSLLRANGAAAGEGQAPGLTLLPAKAKNCIFFYMEGAPSQLDLFSYKPLLNQMHGQRPPESLVANARFAFIDKSKAVLLGTPRTFAQHGASGLWLSDLLPNLATQADRICMLQAVSTSQFNHHPGQLVMQTGSNLPGHPSIGSWLAYGLGRENENLPAYVVLNSSRFITAGESLWGSGFIPSPNGGVVLQATGNPVLNLQRPQGISEDAERRQLASLSRLNSLHQGAVFDPEIANRTAAFELAFKMQSEVPSLTELGQESPATLERYGLARTDPAATLNASRAPAAGVYATFARHCLLARRMVERGVRFVNVFSGSWDMHDSINLEMPFFAGMVDQPIAALIADLAERGLLEETLLVFAGEFGRTPLGQGSADDPAVGRDHHPDAFSIFLAGAGVRPGLTLGKTDDIGWSATEGSVDVADVHATLLRLFGIDHTQLTFRFAGLDQRLTPVTGRAHVIQEILA
jgi:uncharacterized protein (DUF1501 family)